MKHSHNRGDMMISIPREELYNLDIHLAEYIAAALREFKIYYAGIPSDVCSKYSSIQDAQEDWENILDTMIQCFDLISKELDYERTVEENKIVNKGLRLFAKYFQSLWI